MKKKKANVNGKSLTAVIVLVVVILLTIQFVRTSLSDVDNNVDVTLCKSSILRSIAANNPDLPHHIEVPIHCPTQYITVKERTEKEEIKKVFSEKLYGCWDKFGKGELNLFRTKKNENTTYCVICDVISFEEEQEITTTELYAYWEDNKPKGSKKSYLEEFTGKKRVTELTDSARLAKKISGANETGANGTNERTIKTTEEELGSVIEPLSIKTGTPKATLFFYEKKVDWFDRWFAAGFLGGAGLGTGVVAGVIVGITVVALAPVALTAIVGGTIVFTVIAVSTGVLVGGVAGGGTGVIIGLTQFSSLNSEIVSGAYLIDYTEEGLKNVAGEQSCEELPALQTE